MQTQAIIRRVLLDPDIPLIMRDQNVLLMVSRLAYKFKQSYSYSPAVDEDDLFQDALIHLVKATPSYREGEVSYKHYAARVACNAMRKMFSGDKSRNVRQPISLDLVEQHPDADTLKESAINEMDTLVSLHHFVSALSERQKQIFGMLYLQYTHAEIGKKLGVSTKTIQREGLTIREICIKQGGVHVQRVGSYYGSCKK